MTELEFYKIVKEYSTEIHVKNYDNEIVAFFNYYNFEDFLEELDLSHDFYCEGDFTARLFEDYLGIDLMDIINNHDFNENMFDDLGEK